jgi:putative cardiolipin synthase
VPRYLFVALLLPLLLGACAALPDPTDRPRSQYVDNVDSRLAHAVADDIARHEGQSGFHLLEDGLDAFAVRMLLVAAAEQTIDVQYYLFHDDLTANLLLERLLAAADRGVRVRLLIDDMATAGRDADFAALDSHPNFQLRLFNPFASRSARFFEMVTHFGRVSRRMHNKSFTVDGTVTVVGGRNIGNEYFAASPDVEFGDLDVLAAGPAARDVSLMFDAYWNHQLARPAGVLVGDPVSATRLDEVRGRLRKVADEAVGSAYAERIRDSNVVERLVEDRLTLRWGAAEVFADQPDKLLRDPRERSTHMGPSLRRRVGDIERELLIFSPYFVPGDAGVDWLAARVEAGARVRIITNSLASNDVPLVHAGYAKYRRDLLARGIELYEAKPQASPRKQEKKGRQHIGSSSKASLHAKTFVLDRERLFIGSLNLDPRSALLNTEMGIVFESPELAEAVAVWFDEELTDYAYELSLDDQGRLAWVDHRAEGDIRYGHEPRIGLFKRVLVWLAGLLPIEEQL